MRSVNISDRIMKLRGMVEGLSLRELSGLAELYQTHAALIENGRGVSTETAVKLARVFGVTTDWLLTGEGKSPRRDDVRAAVKRAREAGKAA